MTPSSNSLKVIQQHPYRCNKKKKKSANHTKKSTQTKNIKMAMEEAISFKGKFRNSKGFHGKDLPPSRTFHLGSAYLTLF